VTIFYDPMIAKLIVHDHDRPAALARLREALAATEIVGPRSNIDFLERLVRHAAVVDGTIDTGYLDAHLDDVLPQALPPTPRQWFAAAALALLDDELAAREAARTSSDPHSPFAVADAWRPGHPGRRIALLGWRGERQEVSAHGHGGDYAMELGELRAQVGMARVDAGFLGLAIDGVALRLRVHRATGGFTLHDGERRLRFEHLRAYAFEGEATAASDRVVAPMPGRVVDVRTAVGMRVEEGAELLVMEAMKMEITLRAPRAGTIALVAAIAGEFVDADAVLVRYAEE
jgi:3-methylcrotonyl-CoA carboxylase alpha subunit